MGSFAIHENKKQKSVLGCDSNFAINRTNAFHEIMYDNYYEHGKKKKLKSSAERLTSMVRFSGNKWLNSLPKRKKKKKELRMIIYPNTLRATFWLYYYSKTVHNVW